METLLDKCRYYKGENVCPEPIVKAGKELLWYYEKKYVQFGGIYVDNGEYASAELLDFEKNDGVDLSLKMLLFNRFIQDRSLEGAALLFIEWYETEYMGVV